MASPDAHPQPAGFSPRARIRVAFSRGLQRLVEVARDLVSTEGDRELRAGEYVLPMRHLRMRIQSLIELAVALELASGADWDQIAAALGLSEAQARSIYQEKAARWAAGEPVPHGPVLADGSTVEGLPALETITVALVLELDAWCLRNADPADAVTAHPDTRRGRDGRLRRRTSRPVSGELF